MGVDANIAMGFQQPKFESPMNALGQMLQVQQAQGQNALAQYSLNKAQRDDADSNAIRSALAQPGADPYSVLLQRGKVGEATAFAKGQADVKKTGADTDKASMEAAHKRLDIAGQAFGYVRNNPTPEAANATLDYLAQNGVFKPEQVAEYKLQIQQNPGGIKALADEAYTAALSVKDQLTTYTTRNTGGATDTLATNPVTGAITVANTVKNTQSPDSIASNATSRANNRDTIAAENVRAGVMPGGGMDENSERTAQAIASGQLPAPTGMALLNPKNQRILGRVMEINPSYDATTVSAKKAAATAFTSGNQGNAMRSFAVAGQHLDQLGTLVDALDNGNMQIVNKIGNAYSQQTGSPAVTNFDAAKDVVSKEVVKAIVAGGGGVSEREELSKLMSNAKSPAQLKGVIAQYRNLMSAQHDALLQQRRAAGLPDSTLPNYTDANGSPAASTVPPDIAAILQKHGGK